MPTRIIGRAAPATLNGLFDGADAAFSSIGLRSFKRRPTFREVDERVNLHHVDAAERAGVDRFMFVSILHGDELRGWSPLIEARERVVDRLQAGTMTTTIIRPTGFRSTSAGAVASAALGAAGVCLAFAGVQIALAAGAPLGESVWGGTQDRVLPIGMRIIAGGAAVILTTMASVVVRRACLIGRPAHWLAPSTWAIAGLLAVNTLGNLASATTVERFVFGPATAVAAALRAFVAYQTRRR